MINMNLAKKEFIDDINSGKSVVTPKSVVKAILSEDEEYEAIADMLDSYIDSGKDLTVLERVLTNLYNNMHDI